MDNESNVMGGDADDATKLMGALQLDAGDAHDMDEQPPAPELENNDVVETDESKAKAADEAAAEKAAKAEGQRQAPDDDEVEIPGENGAEPTRLKVSALLESHQAYQALKGQEAQVIERVQAQYTQAATERFKAVEQFANETAYAIQGALQLLQAPKAPNADDMLNPMSPNYNPDQYHRDFARWQTAAQQHQQAQGLGRHLLERAQQAQAQITDARETAELNKALQAWPDFGKPETQQKFVSDMGKAYGYSPEELDASLTDHRNLQVARDALAYKELMAKSGATKDKVEKAAPKLVRSQTEAKSAAPQTRDAKGQYANKATEAKQRLSKSHSDRDALAVFTALAEADRI